MVQNPKRKRVNVENKPFSFPSQLSASLQRYSTQIYSNTHQRKGLVSQERELRAGETNVVWGTAGNSSRRKWHFQWGLISAGKEVVV